MTIEYELLKSSHYEHMKSYDDLAKLYPADHPKMKKIFKEIQEIIIKMQKLRK